MDHDALDTLMAGRDTSMVIVTTATDTERAGCLVGFHSQCSIDPVRYAIWLSKANHTCRVATYAPYLAIHFVTTADRALAELFGTTTGDDIDKFSHCNVEVGIDGVPLLVDCPNRLIVRRTAFLEEGSDHLCFVTEPVEASAAADYRPLRFSDVADLTAGHTAEDRPPPDDARSS